MTQPRCQSYRWTADRGTTQVQSTFRIVAPAGAILRRTRMQARQVRARGNRLPRPQCRHMWIFRACRTVAKQISITTFVPASVGGFPDGRSVRGSHAKMGAGFRCGLGDGSGVGTEQRIATPGGRIRQRKDCYGDSAIDEIHRPGQAASAAEQCGRREIRAGVDHEVSQ